MTVKWVGAGMVFLSCSSIGVQAGWYAGRETRMLQRTLNLLRFFEEKLRTCPDYLSRMARQGGAVVGGEIETVLNVFADHLDRKDNPEVYECMQQSLRECTISFQSVNQILEQLGQNFSIFDLNLQQVGLERLIDVNRHLLEEKQNNLPEKIRSFKVMGICIGALAAILLI